MDNVPAFDLMFISESDVSDGAQHGSGVKLSVFYVDEAADQRVYENQCRAHRRRTRRSIREAAILRPERLIVSEWR